MDFLAEGEEKEGGNATGEGEEYKHLVEGIQARRIETYHCFDQASPSGEC